jgi:hypothetical protein
MMTCELLKEKLKEATCCSVNFQLLTAGWRKTFHMRRQNRVVPQMPRYTGVLTTDFK